MIHVETENQAIRNTKIAEENGADGVFLINHRISHKELQKVYLAVRNQFPKFWIGLNFLDLQREHALALMPRDANALWADDGGVHEAPTKGLAPRHGEAKHFSKLLDRSRWKGLYFGGVAFKTQKHANEPALLARYATAFMDVVTTSGVSTGRAPDHEKIREMKDAIGQHPIAIASGVTPENVLGYTLHTDCFLVATGVSDSFTELNPNRVRKFADVLASA
ncbi:MAG: hypothetical protein V4690_01695 [Patescibacteria group bacterium]